MHRRHLQLPPPHRRAHLPARAAAAGGAWRGGAGHRHLSRCPEHPPHPAPRPVLHPRLPLPPAQLAPWPWRRAASWLEGDPARRGQRSRRLLLCGQAVQGKAVGRRHCRHRSAAASPRPLAACQDRLSVQRWLEAAGSSRVGAVTSERPGRAAQPWPAGRRGRATAVLGAGFERSEGPAALQLGREHRSRSTASHSEAQLFG